MEGQSRGQSTLTTLIYKYLILTLLGIFKLQYQLLGYETHYLITKAVNCTGKPSNYKVKQIHEQ